MRTIHLRSVALAAVAVVTLTASALAQTPKSSILNSLDVQHLIKSTEPGDQARLGAHFAALADQYATEAKEHDAMAVAFIASPTRRTAVNAAADHCKRLAELRTDAAKTLRELAVHYDALANGAESKAPKKSGTFAAGAGAPAPTKQELDLLAAKARTTVDHGNLQEYFVNLEKRYTAEANEHLAMAAAYRGTRAAQSAAHCDRLVTLARDSAKEARAAAAMHKVDATN